MHTASKLLRIICILLTLLSVLVCCTAGCTPKNPSASETPDPENPPAPEDPDKEPDYEPGSYVQLIYMCGSSLETNGDADTYPAERYGLILWNHGSGTIDGLCFDQQFHNDSLTLPELDVALAEGTRAIGKNSIGSGWTPA